MNKKIFFILIFLLLLIAVVGYSFLIRNLIISNNTPIPTPTSSMSHTSPSPTIMQTTPTSSEYFCTANNLQSVVSFEGAAGSTYGTLTIKNTSQKSCDIIGNNKLEVTTDAKNISFTYEGTPISLLTLQPNQTIFGQVRYPNGAQCNGNVITAPISFSYAISPATKIAFVTTGYVNAMLTSCSAANEITTIAIWNLSATPFH